MAGLMPDQDLNSDSEEDRRRGVEHLPNLARKLSQMQEGADVGVALTGVMCQGLGKRDKRRCWDHCVEGMKEAIKADMERVLAEFGLEANRIDALMSSRAVGN